MLCLFCCWGPSWCIDGVISSVAIEAVEQGFEVIGFRDGFKWLVRGDPEQHRRLTINDVKAIHLRGGSVLGTSRTNPAKSEADMRNVLDALQRLHVTRLVTVGGDDTAYSG